MKTEVSSNTEFGSPSMEKSRKKERLETNIARAKQRRVHRKKVRELRSKRSWRKKPGRPSIPQISLDAFHYTIQTLKRNGIRVLESHKPVLLIILRKLLNPFLFGAPIRNRDNPRNRKLISKLKKTLTEVGLMMCKDKFSWTKELGQVFLPSLSLVEANLSGRPFKASCRGLRRTGKTSSVRPEVKVELHPVSGKIISRDIVEALKRGTGLYLKKDGVLNELRSIFPNIRDERVWESYSQLVRSAGCGDMEIIPRKWRQVSNGMLFAYDPTIQNLPREIAEQDLMSINGREVWRIDCKSFHLVLWLGLIAVEEIKEEGDYYTKLSKELQQSGLDVERTEIKGEVLSMLSGRTSDSVLDNRKMSKEQRERSSSIQSELHKIVDRRYPKQWKELRANFSRDYDYLNRKGARIFFPCLSAGFRASGLLKMGIPLHDGVIFAADEKQYGFFYGAFCSEAEKLLGHEIPIDGGLLRKAEFMAA